MRVVWLHMGGYLPGASGHQRTRGIRREGGFRCLVTDGESPNSREHALKARAASSALLPSLAVGAIGARTIACLLWGTTQSAGAN